MAPPTTCQAAMSFRIEVSVQKHFMVAVNWYGPYRDINDARRVAREQYAYGLYLAIGKTRRQRKSAMQYVGIGENVHLRLQKDHHKLQLIEREFSLWLGEISTAEPSGRKIQATRATLNYAEWLHARFLGLALNDKKTKKVPPRSVTILNRWYKVDGETPHHRPHPSWPDLIDFPAYNLAARTVWFGARQRKFSFPDYSRPAA